MTELQKKLFSLRDEEYKKFNLKLLPTVEKNSVIGVRMPELRKLVKNFFTPESAAAFMQNLPHEYHEENLIHAALISGMKNYSDCLSATKIFLPFVDNWAVCDSFNPKIFSRHTKEFEPEIKNFLRDEKTFTVRFGILMLMKFYSDEFFDDKHLQLVADVQSKNYYVQTAAAWYFAEVAAKNFDATISFLRDKKLSAGVHEKTIQKICESRKFSGEKKIFIKKFKLK